MLEGQQYQQLGNLQEQVFDELVALSAKLCRVPIAFISLVQEETVWFKHSTGWSGAERLPLGFTLCSVAILRQGSTFFPNLLEEPCLQINNTEIEALGLQFYLGQPLYTAQGQQLGIFAILDQQPRQPDTADFSLLEAFAKLASALFDLYRAMAQHTQSGLGEQHQVYETIHQSMCWMRALAERGGLNSDTISSGMDHRAGITQEAHELTSFVRQYIPLPREGSLRVILA
jgi:GAF domain-containing protein